MKYLTKDYVNKLNLVRILSGVKVSELAEKPNDFTYYKEYKRKLALFLEQSEKDEENLFDKEYETELFKHIIQNKQIILKSLPNEILFNLGDIRFLSLGYCRTADLPLITEIKKQYIKEIDSLSELASKNNAASIDCLPNDIELDFWVDGILDSIYSNKGNYYLQFQDKKTLCIKNGKVLERECSVINKWNINDIYSSWTKLLAIELYYENNEFYLQCLFENRDMYERAKYWEFIIKCDCIFVKQLKK